MAMPPTRKLCRCGCLPPRRAWRRSIVSFIPVDTRIVCVAMMRLRSSRAVGGGTAPTAFSTARTEAIACEVVQAPQILCANAHASRGSRPFRIVSMPRNIVDDSRASVTRPLSISTSTWRCRSIAIRVIVRLHPPHRVDYAARGDAGGHEPSGPGADRVDAGVDTAGQVLVERRVRVPKLRLRAAETWVPRGDRPLRAAV